MAYHVLIAEDETVTREAIRAGLSRLLPAARIHVAKNGVEAVACAMEQEIGLAFLDIRMPEMNGITAAQKIRTMQADCQMVFLTAYDDFEYVRSALKLDVVDYLLKPFDQGTLAEALQKVMKRLGDDAEAIVGAGGGLSICPDEVPVRWLEEPEMEALFDGTLDPSLIPAGGCGCVVALAGPEEGLMQRLKHVLTGLDMGEEIRCLMGRRKDCLLIAAWSITPDLLQEQIKKQLDMLAARLERQFGVRLCCGISEVFLDDGDLPEACREALARLDPCRGKEPASENQGEAGS